MSSTCAAIGEIARSGPLPIPSDDGGEGGDGGGAEGNEGGSGKSEALSKRGIVACLAGKLKSAKEVKVSLFSVTALLVGKGSMKCMYGGV